MRMLHQVESQIQDHFSLGKNYTQIMVLVRGTMIQTSMCLCNNILGIQQVQFLSLKCKLILRNMGTTFLQTE